MEDPKKNDEEKVKPRFSINQWVQTLLAFIFQLNRKKLIEHEKILKEQNDKFNELKEKENQIYLEKKRKLEEETAKKLKYIEESTKEEISNTNKKYQDLFDYLDNIKGDQEKLIEFFKHNILNL